MKLFVISNMYPSPKHVGYGVFVKRFLEALENEFELEKIVLTKKENLLAKLLGYAVLYLKIIRLYFVVNKNDIVYVHFPLYFSCLLAPFIWKSSPLVLNFHGSDAIFNTRIKRILFLGLKPIVRDCHKIIVPSDYYAKKVGEVFNIKQNRFFVYPSGGVDKCMFYPIQKEKRDFVFGFISNFIQTKGWAVFLEALFIVETNHKSIPFRAIMVGSGPDFKKIKKEIKAKNLNVMLIDTVNQSKLVDIYAEFNVFVFPTYRDAESLGLVGLEALMCGVPVIASKVGGPMGYIEHGVNGYLVKKNNSKDLAKKMLEFQNLSQNAVDSMIHKGVETAQKYESSKVKKELIGLLNNL